MKKLALLFGAAALAFTSCTKDDSTAVVPILVKSIKVGDVTTVVTYDGNKVVKTNGSDGNTGTYTYTGDLITRYESTNGVNQNRSDYTYDNGKLISVSDSSNNGNGSDLTLSDKTEYVYNSDGTVTSHYFYVDGGTLQTSTTSSITFQNGNMIKIENFDKSGTSLAKTVYEYDTKINPYSYIIGFDKFFNSGFAKNNITKIAETYDSSPGTTVTRVTTRTYTYNDKGYPLTSQSTIVSSATPDAPQVTNVQFGY